MKTDYSTGDGQIQLMRESVGQPTEFPKKKASSGFKVGDILDWKNINMRDTLEYLRDGEPECGLPVVIVKFSSGVTGGILARDVQIKNQSVQK